MPTRVDVTEEAADMLRRLFGEAGPAHVPPVRRLLRRQFPMCYPAGSSWSPRVRMCCGACWIAGRGRRAGVHVRAAVRVLEAHPPDHRPRARTGWGFSLEAPTGFRFMIRSRLLTDEEYAALG